MNSHQAIVITEEMHLEKEWFADAKKQTVDTIAEFCRHIMEDYHHDYGTIVHAVSACALAAACAADNHANGGITGFQAGFVMWDFVRQWEYKNNKTGLRIIDYDNMLYPQNGHSFDKVIKKRTWEAIQKEAERLLKSAGGAADAVEAHWQSIVDGVVPFGYHVEDEE